VFVFHSLYLNDHSAHGNHTDYPLAATFVAADLCLLPTALWRRCIRRVRDVLHGLGSVARTRGVGTCSVGWYSIGTSVVGMYTHVLCAFCRLFRQHVFCIHTLCPVDSAVLY